MNFGFARLPAKHQKPKRAHDEPDTREIPVIFLTGKTDAVDEAKGFDLGAVDYILLAFRFMVDAMRDTHANP